MSIFDMPDTEVNKLNLTHAISKGTEMRTEITSHISIAVVVCDPKTRACHTYWQECKVNVISLGVL